VGPGGSHFESLTDLKAPLLRAASYIPRFISLTKGIGPLRQTTVWKREISPGRVSKIQSSRPLSYDPVPDAYSAPISAAI
jgi:hypothetical protein